MISSWIIAVLTLLCVANALLLGALAYCGRGKTDKATKIGFSFMAAVLVLDIFFSVGGVLLW